MSFHTAARPCAFTCNVWFWSESEALECQTHKSVNGVGCSLYVLHSDRLYVALVFTQCRHRPVSKLNRCPEFHVRVFLHFIQSTSSLMIYSNEKYCSVCKCVLYNLLRIVFLCGSLMLHTPGIARCIMCKWFLSFTAKLQFFCISSQWSSFIFQCISSWEKKKKGLNILSCLEWSQRRSRHLLQGFLVPRSLPWPNCLVSSVILFLKREGSLKCWAVFDA